MTTLGKAAFASTAVAAIGWLVWLVNVEPKGPPLAGSGLLSLASTPAEQTRGTARPMESLDDDAKGNEGAETASATLLAQVVERKARSDELLRQQGYHEVLSPYWYYDDETLRGLAAHGDSEAMNMYAYKRISADPVEAIGLFRQAAAHGGTWGLMQIAQVYGLMAEEKVTPRGREPGAPPDVDAYTIESVAWALAAQARGDLGAIGFVERQLQHRALTRTQVEAACRKANEHYADLANARSKLGTDSFQNVPMPLSDRDYGAASEVCDTWPVPRPVCRRVQVSTPERDVDGYFCDRPGGG